MIMYSDDLKEYQNLCLDKNSVVVGYNVDKYCDFLLRNGRIQSKCDFYMGTFTLVRDSFYLKNEVNLILVLSNEEFEIFISEFCDDFTDYACIKLEYSSVKDLSHSPKVFHFFGIYGPVVKSTSSLMQYSTVTAVPEAPSVDTSINSFLTAV